METTNNIELRDETIYPDDNVLSAILGDSFQAYQALIKLFDDNQLTHEWRYYKDGKAWLCKVQKKRTKTIAVDVAGRDTCRRPFIFQRNTSRKSSRTGYQ